MGSQVKDFMSKKIKSVSPETNAKDALKILIGSGASGLPVLDTDGNLLGVFTEREVLEAILPVYLKNVGTFVYTKDSKSTLKKMAGIEKFTVKDLMRKDVPTLNEDASITEASRIMLTKSERRIIVVKDNKIVGVITRCDVVRGLAAEAGMTF